jgi:AAT family amino acid transporter
LFTVITLSIICVTFVFSDQNRISIITCLIVLAALILISIFKFKRVDKQETPIIEKNIAK